MDTSRIDGEFVEVPVVTSEQSEQIIVLPPAKSYIFCVIAAFLTISGLALGIIAYTFEKEDYRKC